MPASAAVNQIEIHPFLAWDQCTEFCKKENIAIMAYSPLAKAEKLRNPTLCKIARQYDIQLQLDYWNAGTFRNKGVADTF